MSDSTGLNYKDYLDCLKDEEYIALYNYYSKETMMEILGVSRQENPHSSFLRWLLDSSSDHGCGTMPMRKFLETVCLFKEKVYEVESSLDNYRNKLWQSEDNFLRKETEIEEIKYGRYEIINQAIAKEVVLEDQRRADIFGIFKIKMPALHDNNDKGIRYLVLMIENKVYSTENYVSKTDPSDHKKITCAQTELYVEDLKETVNLKETIESLNIDWADERTEKNTIKLFVFLNAFPTSVIKNVLSKIAENKTDSKKGPFAKSNEFITLNYQYLLDGVIEPISNIISDAVVKQKIKDYIRCLGQAKITSIGKQSKKRNKGDNEKYLIMALSKHEKRIAISLWTKYYKVINPILESIFGKETDKRFLIGERDRDLWISLANLYRLIEKKDFGISLNEEDGNYNKERVNYLNNLKVVVEKANNVNNSRKHIFTFNGNRYESYKTKSIGMLCRDIIADFINEQEKQQGDIDEKWIENLRTQMQKWHENWLREVILFDDEVETIQNNYDSYVTKSKSKYKTEDIKVFADHYFSYMNVYLKKNKEIPEDFLYEKELNEDECQNKYDFECPHLEIKLKNGHKIYVAKFWTAASVEKLKSLLDKDYGCDYKNRVIEIK